MPMLMPQYTYYTTGKGGWASSLMHSDQVNAIRTIFSSQAGKPLFDRKKNKKKTTFDHS